MYKKSTADKYEHIVAKGKFAHGEQLILLPQCFLKLSAADASKCICKLEKVKL